MIVEFISSFLIPVILTLIITPWVIKFAKRIGAVDQPGDRKVHETITPRIGGMAVFISAVISILGIYLLYPHLFAGILEYKTQIAIISCCMVGVFLLGFWDDLRTLKPGPKFGVQFIIAGILYFAGFKISIITNPIGAGILNVEMLDFPLTLLWIVGITNAFNLIDGLDGLASGVATIAAVSIFTVSAISGEIWSATLSMILAGSLVGFLRYNFNPARIFLGDSGSLTIGFSLALLSIQSTTKISTGFALLFPLLVLGLPIMDTIISMLRRFLGTYLPDNKPLDTVSIKSKLRSMFVPDRSHIHHQLITLGFTHRDTVIVLYFVSALFAMSAFIITQIDTFEKSIFIGVFLLGILFLGIKKLQYHEIAIFNNGLMIPFYERWILQRTTFIGLIDMGFVGLSFTLSYLLIKSINPELTGSINLKNSVIAVLSVQVLIFWISGLYRETIRQLGIGDALRITGSVTYATLGAVFALYVINDISVLTVLQYLVLDFYFLLTFILGFRIAYQALSYWFHRDKRIGEHVLIYGANENGTMILHKMNNSPDNRFKMIGFLDEDPELEGKMLYGYPIFGGHWKLLKILLQQKIDRIFICDNNIKPEDFNRLKSIAGAKNIPIEKLQITLKSVDDQVIHSNGYTHKETMISYI
ncbi:hypothetical protein [Fodinibius sp. AD559]|uniref:hypothetical protein n=1 Tax=Fodinibius sp. AD559 TaxID=3424179 RepID=UPI0040469FF8